MDVRGIFNHIFYVARKIGNDEAYSSNKQSQDEPTYVQILISGVVTYLGDVPEIEEVVYLSGCGQHACGDVVIDLYGGLSHDVSQWLHILVKVLQLLVDHGAKDALDLAGLKGRYAMTIVKFKSVY